MTNMHWTFLGKKIEIEIFIILIVYTYRLLVASRPALVLHIVSSYKCEEPIHMIDTLLILLIRISGTE